MTAGRDFHPNPVRGRVARVVATARRLRVACVVSGPGRIGYDRAAFDQYTGRERVDQS